jgi:type VI secretion system secreted protein Hcp
VGSSTGGAGAGKVQCGAITVMKNIDTSSPLLLKAVAMGSHFDQGTLTFRAASDRGMGGAGTDYYTITMTEVFVNELSQTDAADPNRIFEKLVLNARAYEFKYTPTTIKGQLGKPVSFKWDCAENSAG